MIRTTLCLALALAVGCKVYDPLYCDENKDCTDPKRPFCDLAGEYPDSEGVARTCIPDPNGGQAGDGGVPDGGPDGGADDDGGPTFTYPEPHVYWGFDQADVTGSILTARQGDVSGEIAGPAVDGDSVVGEAFQFGGDPDNVDFGDALDDVFAGSDRAFTISVWIKPASVAGTAMVLVKAGAKTCEPPQDNRQLNLVLSEGLPQFRFWSPANLNARYLSAATPLVLDVWQHVLVTYDGAVDLGPVNRVRLYVDGVPQPLTVTAMLGGFPYDIQGTDAHFALGKIVGAAGDPCGAEQFVGSLDELAVWSSVIGPEQAAEVHARGEAGLALWPL